MDEDQQVAALLHINLNVTNGGTPSFDSPSQNNLSPPNPDISNYERYKSDEEDHILDANSNSIIKKDLEFLRKHARDADPDFLQSLLESQIDNPKRLESIMCEVLNIPNAQVLIGEFRKNAPRPGEKRSVDAINLDEPEKEEEEIKKKKSKESGTYLKQIRDMFPDADGLFLISECQQFENWEDCSRFINTVMINKLYPKKGSPEYSPINEPLRVVDIVNDRVYRTTVNYSSDDEISSTELNDSPKQKIKNRENNKRNNLIPPEIEVVDLSSDNTEPYDPVAVEDVFNGVEFENSMEVDENVQPKAEPVETTLDEDIHNILQNQSPNRTIEEPQPGPSRENPPIQRSRFSLPGGHSPVKSLAEIIEEGRHPRKRSYGDVYDLEQPSTSRAGMAIQEENFFEISSPETSNNQNNEEWMDEQTANLIRIFPNTDPSFLREEVEKMNGSLEAMNEFVVSKLERNDMPTRADYEKKKEMEELLNRYTNNFSIEDFLKALPDPWKYFTDENRNCAKYKSHSLCYLKSMFRKYFVRDIIQIFHKNKSNLYLSYQELKKGKIRKRGSIRSEYECNSNRPTTIDIQFLQEVAFIENEDKIKEYIENEKLAKQLKFDEAKRTGSLLECQCCFDSEVIVEDIVYCPKDHPFCKECVIKSVEVEMGNGRHQFECLANCDEKFTLPCLQSVLKPEVFSKVLQAIQIEEIKAAGIDDLVQCPFCNYATIMPPEEKVMTCLNPECLKESCRLCKELNHVPLRCDEVEKSEDVKMRTYIENKMTEALVRTCYKCSKKFVKEDGCNKMTCTCGAKMCYVCRKPVTDYSHFNALGGTEYHKCPLYALNDELHVDLVKRVAEEAKAEILQANPQAKLLHDPTMVLPERTHEEPKLGMNVGVALNVGLRAIRGTLDEENNEVQVEENRNPNPAPRRPIAHHYRRPEVNHNHHHYRYPRHHYRVRVESEDEEEENNNNENHHQHYRHHHHHHHPPINRHPRIRQNAYRDVNRHPHFN